MKGRLQDAVFECRGSSTNGGVTAQIQTAGDQVAPYKNRGKLGIISAVCVPRIGARDRPCLYLSDPPADDESDVSPFQTNIASLAAAIDWAGEPGLAHELASAVVSFGESTPELRRISPTERRLNSSTRSHRCCRGRMTPGCSRGSHDGASRKQPRIGCSPSSTGRRQPRLVRSSPKRASFQGVCWSLRMRQVTRFEGRPIAKVISASHRRVWPPQAGSASAPRTGDRARFCPLEIDSRST